MLQRYNPTFVRARDSNKLRNGIITWHRFIGDIGMPALFAISFSAAAQRNS